MKVISLVPSWTETLIESGVSVVGRTRYCIHPQNQVQNIPVVGGTKDVNWQKLADLGADLLILDKEENPKIFAEKSPIPVYASHAESILDLPGELRNLGQILSSKALKDLASEWESFGRKKTDRPVALSNLPGLSRWINKPEDLSQIKQLVYLIWKDPWMTVGPNTFIGSIFAHLGWGFQSPGLQKYPEIKIENLNPQETLLLFSSEPYPFEKKQSDLKKLPYFSALVDGELYSWFGLRSLRKIQGQI